jgi:hypothetical protein
MRTILPFLPRRFMMSLDLPSIRLPKADDPDGIASDREHHAVQSPANRAHAPPPWLAVVATAILDDGQGPPIERQRIHE